jgi:hypothetical protein
MRRDWWSYLYGVHRNTLERSMRQGQECDDRSTSAEAVVHGFFRNNSNHFHDLEVAAEAMRLEVRPALSARDEVIE